MSFIKLSIISLVTISLISLSNGDANPFPSFPPSQICKFMLMTKGNGGVHITIIKEDGYTETTQEGFSADWDNNHNHISFSGDKNIASIQFEFYGTFDLDHMEIQCGVEINVSKDAQVYTFKKSDIYRFDDNTIFSTKIKFLILNKCAFDCNQGDTGCLNNCMTLASPL